MSKFTLYRIYYGDDIVYIGRAKQPLQNRIRGHLFAKPMHRTIRCVVIHRFGRMKKTETEVDSISVFLYFCL